MLGQASAAATAELLRSTVLKHFSAHSEEKQQPIWKAEPFNLETCITLTGTSTGSKKRSSKWKFLPSNLLNLIEAMSAFNQSFSFSVTITFICYLFWEVFCIRRVDKQSESQSDICWVHWYTDSIGWCLRHVVRNSFHRKNWISFLY